MILLDTSVIIDGRVADICETGFIDGTANPTLDELLKLDAWARQEIQRWILA